MIALVIGNRSYANTPKRTVHFNLISTSKLEVLLNGLIRHVAAWYSCTAAAGKLELDPSMSRTAWIWNLDVEHHKKTLTEQT